MDAGSPTEDRLAGRRLRVGIYSAEERKVVVERTFDPGADVTVGADDGATLVVPGWVGPPLCIFSEGVNLHLGPGMHLHMCHDRGEDRIQGTFEDLVDAGIAFPLRL
jgi:hypothetical protein